MLLGGREQLSRAVGRAPRVELKTEGMSTRTEQVRRREEYDTEEKLRWSVVRSGKCERWEGVRMENVGDSSGWAGRASERECGLSGCAVCGTLWLCGN